MDEERLIYIFPNINFSENTIPEIREFVNNVANSDFNYKGTGPSLFEHTAINMAYDYLFIAEKYSESQQLQRIKEHGLRTIATNGPLIIPLLIDKLKLPITEQELTRINMNRLSEEELKNLEHINVDLLPEDAQKRLENLGISKDDWDHFLGNEQQAVIGIPNAGSHELTALIMISRGSIKRNLRDVYTALRASKGLPPEFSGLVE